MTCFGLPRRQRRRSAHRRRFRLNLTDSNRQRDRCGLIVGQVLNRQRLFDCISVGGNRARRCDRLGRVQSGAKGELWYARLFPPLDDGASYHVAFITLCSARQQRSGLARLLRAAAAAEPATTADIRGKGASPQGAP